MIREKTGIKKDFGKRQVIDFMQKTRSHKQSHTVSSGRAKSRQKSDYYDYSLVAVIVLLICFGLVMLYSTSSYMAEVKQGDDMFYFKKQALISLACLGMALVISRIDYHILKHFSLLLYITAFLLMVLVKTPLGSAANGAQRWLQIGPIQFQPSEIAKVAVIVTLPHAIVIMGKRVKSLKACALLFAAGLLLAGGAYILTDNLSTAIIIACITVGLIFVAHPNTKIFFILGGAGVALIAAAVLFLNATLTVSGDISFRVRRIMVWLHPEDFADSWGYQTIQALYAIGSGGFFGRGLGNSIQKLGSVPEAQNDMIFSIICEELGIFGGMLVLFLYAYLLYRLFFIAQNASDMFGSLMVSGVFIHIALQVILNVAVVVNLLPNTGVTLPFISYGGTSIVFLMAEMGLALSVARQIKFQENSA